MSGFNLFHHRRTLWTRPLRLLQFGVILQLLATASVLAEPIENELSEPAENEQSEPAESVLTKSAGSRLEYPVGSMVAYPIFEISTGFDGGVYAFDNTGNTGAAFFGLALGGGLQGERRGHIYGLEYVVDNGIYTGGNSDDNFFDQRLVAYWGTAFTLRHNIDLGIEYLSGHDTRGQDDAYRGARYSVDTEDFDVWDQTQLGAIYVFGAPGARGRIELSGCSTCRRFNNNHQGYRDVDIYDLGGALYVRVSPKVDGLVQLVHSEFDYIDQGPDDPTEGRSLDSTERRYLIGAEWDATRRMSGRLRFGWVEKEFTSGSGREDYSNPTWDLRLDWTPRSLTNLQVGYSNRPYETVYTEDEILNDFVESQQVDASWNQQWRPRLSTTISAYRQWDDWSPTTRSDDLYGIAFGVDYVFNRWASVGITVSYEERDSNFDRHDYQDNSISLHLNIGEILGFGYNRRGPDICDLR